MAKALLRHDGCFKPKSLAVQAGSATSSHFVFQDIVGCRDAGKTDQVIIVAPFSTAQSNVDQFQVVIPPNLKQNKCGFP